MMNFPSQDEIATYRRWYPEGTRIEMIHMEDPFSPIEAGTCGTVKFIDDAGQMHMRWDNGRTLAIIIGEDCFKVIKGVQREDSFEKDSAERN